MKNIKISTKPYVYKIDNVNVIRVNLLYPVQVEPRYLDTYKLRLMNNIMGKSSKKYNEIDIFNKVLDKNLVIRYKIGYFRFVNELFITVQYAIPKEGLIDDFDIDEAFKLLHELLYNPDVSSKKFNSKNFNWSKDIMLNQMKQEINNIYDLSEEETRLFFDPESKYYIHKDEAIKLVEQTTPENVYEYYEKNIKNNKFISFIFGAINDEDKILKTFNKYFKQEECLLNIKAEEFNYIPYTDYQEKEIKTKYNQSVISQIYQVERIKEKDEITMRMLFDFLYSKENALIFSTLRNKYHLVYECSVKYNHVHGLIFINALMDKNDRELINKLIEETIYSLRDEEVFNRCKNNLLRSLSYDLLDDEDDDFHDVLVKISKLIKWQDDIEYYIKQVKKVDFEKMNELLTRFKLSRNLFMEGGHYEENL